VNGQEKNRKFEYEVPEYMKFISFLSHFKIYGKSFFENIETKQYEIRYLL